MAVLDHVRQNVNNSLQIIANNTAGTNQLGTTPRATYKAGPDGLPIPAVTDDSTKGTAGTGTEKQLTIPGMEGLDLAARRGLTIAHGAGASPFNPGVIFVPETGGYIIYDEKRGSHRPATREEIEAQDVYNLHMQIPKFTPHGHGENTSNKQRSLQIA